MRQLKGINQFHHPIADGDKPQQAGGASAHLLKGQGFSSPCPMDEKSGSHLLGKGYNQAYNQNEGVTTSKMAKGYNHDEIWLTRAKVQELLGISHQALIKAIKKGKFKAIETNGNGGRQYRIALYSLPAEAQMRYLEQNPELKLKAISIVSPEVKKEIVREFDTEAFIEEDVEAEIYARAPEWARKKADKYLRIIKATEGLKGRELINYINEWNQRYPEFKTSYQRVVDARKRYREEGIAGLLARYGNRAGETKVHDEWFEYFKACYLKEGALSLKSCWLRTLGYARSKDNSIEVGKFPNPVSFLRRLKRELPKDAIYLARYGREAWNRKYGNYIERDFSNVKAGECWVSDHAQVDVAVIDPKTGKPAFPWITAFADYKSGKWLGWIHHIEAPNSDHVFQSFYDAALKHGLPKDVYIDNGKDYRCRDFAGGRRRHKVVVNEADGRVTTLALLKIRVHFSLPYNAQAKSIERDFLKCKEWFSKHMPGYRGGHTKERPEVLKEEIKTGKILQWNQYTRLMDDFIENVINKMPSQGRLKGMCPDEVWQAEVTELRKVSKDALRLFCMRSSKELTIGRNGIYDSELGVRYWAEWMVGMKGEKVYIRRDIKAYQEAWVFRTSDDEYLGKAVIGEFVAPALAKTEVEKQVLKEVMAKKRQAQKVIKAYVQAKESIDTSQALMHMATGINEVNRLRGYEPEEEVKIIRLANTEMDRVIKRDKEMQKEGMYDLSLIQPVKKQKIALFECELEDVRGG